MKKFIIPALILVALSLIIIASYSAYSAKETSFVTEGVKEPAVVATSTAPAKPIARIGDTSIRIDIARTAEERNKGLSGRETLPDGEGLLFIFEEPKRYGFWMKDMNFPIDIIWIDKDKRIVGVEKNATPASYFTQPVTVFYPQTDILYVLEVPAGFFERQNLKIGEMFFFS